ncbi:MAG: (d)CMP kinase [Lachnospiraceae bacterium]
MGYSVAIDGPAGAGKSTIAKQIARKLDFIYVDTGAMYRAMAYYLLQNHVDASDTAAIDVKCREADIRIRYENKEQQVWLNGENVNGMIRTEEVGNMASASSVNPNVRAKLVELQRKMAETDNVIMDGRDIGTTVLPNADVKIYLTAGSHVRARRRYEELKEKGTICDLETIERDIIERDERDMNREISPLRQAEDAVLVDSSDMTVEEVLGTIEEVIREDRGRKGLL